MVPVTDAGASDATNLKLLLHRAVHDQYDPHRERPGWFRSPLATACAGRALQTHRDVEDQLAQIDDELQRWVDDQEFDRVPQSTTAALGLIAAYFADRPDDRGVPAELEDVFRAELDREIDGYERRAGERVKDSELQFFGTPLYVYCAWVGVRTFGWTAEYDTFFETLLDDHRDPEWPDVVWLSYLEPVRLERSGYDDEVCEEVRTELQQIDLDELDVTDLFPLLWFIETYWPEVAKHVDTGAATAVIEDLRRDAWQRLYAQYDQGEVLHDGAANPEHIPIVEELTFLDRVIGRSEDEVLVLTESELDDRFEAAHGDLVDENETLERRRNREQRWKLLGGVGLVCLVGYVLWTDGLTRFDLQPLLPELVAVYLVVIGYFELELLMRLLDTTDRLPGVQSGYDRFRNVLLGVLASLIAILLMSMLDVVSLEFLFLISRPPDRLYPAFRQVEGVLDP